MLTLLDEFFAKALHHRVALNRAEHGHVEHSAYARATTFSFASPLHSATVTIKWLQAAQGCNLAGRELTQLWQFTQQDKNNAIVHARNRNSNLIGALPLSHIGDRSSQKLISPLYLIVE